MKFSLEYGIFKLNIILEKDQGYVPPPKKYYINKRDKKDLDKGILAFYNLVIETIKDDTMTTHYKSGIILTFDENKAKKIFIKLLEDGEYLEDIVDYWDLLESNDGPDWKEDIL